jgi:hypothetical protein
MADPMPCGAHYGDASPPQRKDSGDGADVASPGEETRDEQTELIKAARRGDMGQTLCHWGGGC